MSQKLKSCLLSRDDINIVSENDHRVGLCLCKYCTCGKHFCPSVRTRKNSMPAAFLTNYQISYRGKTGEKIERLKRDEYTPSSQPMDLDTTHRREFRPFSVERSSKVHQRPQTPSLQFTARSSYSAEFPNWGSTDPAIEKKPQYPLRNSEVKFQGNSTYQRNFKPPENRLQSRPLSRTRESNLFGGEENHDESTVQRTFKPYDSSCLSKSVGRPKEEYIRVAASPLHFTSVYHSQYRPPSAQLLDPHIVRKNISMYLS